jgi:hypothetical protein
MTTSTAVARRRSSLSLSLIPTTGIAILEGKKQIVKLQQMRTRQLARLAQAAPQIEKVITNELRNHVQLSRLRPPICLPGGEISVDMEKAVFAPFSEDELKQHWFQQGVDSYDPSEPIFIRSNTEPAKISFLQRLRRRTGFWRRLRGMTFSGFYPSAEIMRQVNPALAEQNKELDKLIAKHRGEVPTVQVPLALIRIRIAEAAGVQRWQFKRRKKSEMLSDQHISSVRKAMIEADEANAGNEIDRKDGDDNRHNPIDAAQKQEEQVAHAYERSMRDWS